MMTKGGGGGKDALKTDDVICEWFLNIFTINIDTVYMNVFGIFFLGRKFNESYRAGNGRRPSYY